MTAKLRSFSLFSRRHFDFLLRRCPFAPDWACDQFVKGQHIQIPLNGARSDAEFIDQILCCHSPVFENVLVHVFDSNEHAVSCGFHKLRTTPSSLVPMAKTSGRLSVVYTAIKE